MAQGLAVFGPTQSWRVSVVFSPTKNGKKKRKKQHEEKCSETNGSELLCMMLGFQAIP